MQLGCPGTKSPGLCEENYLYDDFDMDEVDLDLENYEELFGVALSHSEELFENGGIDSLFGTKDMSAADSSCQGAVAAEVLSSNCIMLPMISSLTCRLLICYIYWCLVSCVSNSLSMPCFEVCVSLNVLRILNYAIFLVLSITKGQSNTCLLISKYFFDECSFNFQFGLLYFL